VVSRTVGLPILASLVGSNQSVCKARPTLDRLVAVGLTLGPVEHPGGPDGPAGGWLTDLDGTGSSWSSGRLATPTASPLRTSIPIAAAGLSPSLRHD